MAPIRPAAFLYKGHSPVSAQFFQMPFCICIRGAIFLAQIFLAEMKQGAGWLASNRRPES
jgi:hypothetical protein